MGIANNGVGQLEPPAPARFADIAIDDRLRIKAGGDEHGAGRGNELRPGRSDADELAFEVGQVW